MPAPDRAALLAFLRKHRLGVLSTVSPEGKPEAAVVGIAISDDLEIVFDTLDTTRKIRNLRRSRNIAFVIGGAFGLADAIPSDYVVKLRGWEVLGEQGSVAESGARDGSTYLISYRRRRAVR